MGAIGGGAAGDSGGEALGEAQRKRVLSGLRMSVTLVALVTSIVLVFAASSAWLVDRAFRTLTPAIERDLRWKAERGVVELSKTTELGVAAADRETVARACQDYTQDADVEGIGVYDADGHALYRHGHVGPPDSLVSSQPAGRAREHEGRIMAWSSVEIEGLQLGMVVIAISSQRLAAGERLHDDLLGIAMLVALGSLMLALAFVALRISPLLRLTRLSFERLAETTELALESARVKGQFLTNMSHEIRTPLNGIMGLSRLMLAMPLESRLRRYVETIDASGRSLMTVINDILDFSKLEAGRYAIREVEFEVRTATQEVAELFAVRAHAKQLELICEIDPALPSRLIGDPDRYRQVLSNLVGNAIKFTERGEVIIALGWSPTEEGGVGLEVQVRDTGPGIAAEHQETIFEAFSQQDGSAARSYGGTGLGLAISRRLLELMGGRIRVRSTPGEGSVFCFNLPLRAAKAAALKREPLSYEGRRVLLVDANDHARKVTAERLQAWGLRCTQESRGEVAVARLREAPMVGEPYDLALIAARCTDMAGEEVVRRIRQEPATRELPLIFMAQVTTTSSGAGPMPGGPLTQLQKPIRISELYNALLLALSPEHHEAHRSGDSSSSLPGAVIDGPRILIVDDNEINQFVALEQVEALGYKTELASDGRQAVEAALSGRVAAVLMDCQMPVMDGYAATREIRRQEGTDQRIPIIALTAHGMPSERAKVLDAGMDDYLAKPLQVAALGKVLAHLLPQTTPWRGSRRRSGRRLSDSLPESEPELDPEVERSPALIELFFRHVPGQMQNLERALRDTDLALAARHAHKLKGSFASLGAKRLADRAGELQHRCAQGQGPGCEDPIAQMRQEVMALRNLLSPDGPEARP
ncbi:MAG: response regulator [Myxococcales bacterium]|nr:response regulator [Myxococcales bacterium]